MAAIGRIGITVIDPITIVGVGMTLKDWASAYPFRQICRPSGRLFLFTAPETGPRHGTQDGGVQIISHFRCGVAVPDTVQAVIDPLSYGSFSTLMFKHLRADEAIAAMCSGRAAARLRAD